MCGFVWNHNVDKDMRNKQILKYTYFVTDRETIRDDLHTPRSQLLVWLNDPVMSNDVIGFGRQKQVSETGIRNCIPQYFVRFNYLSLPDIRATGIKFAIYRQVSKIRRALEGNTIVDHSNVVGASPVDAAPTTSSFSTQHLASMGWAKATAWWDENHLSFDFGCVLY